MDVIGQLIADVNASGFEHAKIAAAAGMTPSLLSKILSREQLPTVPEFFAIRRAIGLDVPFSEEVVGDLERLRVAMQGDDRSERLPEILEDLLRALDRK